MRDFVTEAEAKQRMCPLQQINQDGDTTLCIASQCMAWRWSHQDHGPTDPPTGFCGAAGLPKYI